MAVVGIVGAGFIGRAWTVVFARSGWEAVVTDPSAEVRAAFPGLLRRSLDDLAAYGLVNDAAAVAARVRVVPTVAEAVAGVDFVQESGPERVEIKREIFSELDRLTPPSAIIASSTSAIVASQFTERLPGRARCLVGHPVNPPHLVPLVEVCGAPWTDPEVVERARAIYASTKQVPIIVHREVDGFVLNRLQGAVLNEALRLVGEGVVSPQDLDKTLKDGLGRRWSFMGPFETIELNAPGGIGDYATRYSGMYRIMGGDPPGSKVWDEPTVSKLVAAWGAPPSQDMLDQKGAWRDRRLAALQAHMLDQPAAPGVDSTVSKDRK